MCSSVQQYSMWQAIRHVDNNQIPGDVAEFGVWRGGMSMIAAQTIAESSTKRFLYMFDTFQGMTTPSSKDVELYSRQSAAKLLERETNSPGKWTTWANASLADVQDGIRKTELSEDHIRFIVGDVSATVPSLLPTALAVCRIDTDWYESTLHCLRHAWPRIPQGGVLLLDDYDHWEGARTAVDEYFDEIGLKVFLVRTEIGRLVIK